MVIRALFGPRPVYSANSLTIRLLIAAASEPGARSCVSMLDTPASRLIPLSWSSRAQDRGKRGEPHGRLQAPSTLACRVDHLVRTRTEEQPPRDAQAARS